MTRQKERQNARGKSEGKRTCSRLGWLRCELSIQGCLLERREDLLDSRGIQFHICVIKQAADVACQRKHSSRGMKQMG